LKPLSEVFPPIKVGDTVQRGLDWKWGDQDSNGIGIVTDTLDHEGWVHVRWESGRNNKYRYSEQAGGHDVQLCGKIDSSASADAIVQTAPKHSGTWRVLKKLRYYCSRSSQVEGQLCQHDGIVTDNHWTCCGETKYSSECRAVGNSVAFSTLAVGTSVKVQGVKCAAWLNGARGKVKSFDERAGRYNVLIVEPASAVEMSQGKLAALKRENIEVCS
jgi:hypothetical protein